MAIPSKLLRLLAGEPGKIPSCDAVVCPRQCLSTLGHDDELEGPALGHEEAVAPVRVFAYDPVLPPAELLGRPAHALLALTVVAYVSPAGRVEEAEVAVALDAQEVAVAALDVDGVLQPDALVGEGDGPAGLGLEDHEGLAGPGHRVVAVDVVPAALDGGREGGSPGLGRVDGGRGLGGRFAGRFAGLNQ